jgi:outer membrane protein assembly factor BamE
MIDRIHDSEERTQMQKLIKTIPLVIALTVVSGCVYKRDLPQGNYITEGMVQQLQPGMSRSQVVNVMGRPLLEAPFDANQWDYVFRLDEAYGAVQQRRVTLTFDGEQLVNVQREGDFSEDIELRPQDDIGPAVEGASPMGEMPASQPEAAPEAAPDAGGTLPQGGEPASTEPLEL